MLMKMRSKMQRTNNQKGFTLVELMVVVVIIGVLVAIAVPVYNNVSEKARLNAHLANIRAIEGAVEVYKADNDVTSNTGIDDNALSPTYISWPTKPGTYSMADGVLTANPTKAATEAAIGGGTAVTWP